MEPEYLLIWKWDDHLRTKSYRRVEDVSGDHSYSSSHEEIGSIANDIEEQDNGDEIQGEGSPARGKMY